MIRSLEPVLEMHPFLRGLSSEHIQFLSGCAQNLQVRAGGYLFRSGDPADAMFLLRRGRVALEIDEPPHGVVRTETLSAPEMAGWSWLYPPYRWHLDGRVIEDVLTFRFDGVCLRAKLEKDPALGFELTKRILYQAHQRLERARMQRLDVYRNAGRSAS